MEGATGVQWVADTAQGGVAKYVTGATAGIVRLGATPGQMVFSGNTTDVVKPGEWLNGSTLAYLIQKYVGPSGSNYVSYILQEWLTLTIPAGYTTMTVTNYLVAKLMNYTGSTAVSGTVSRNGTASSGTINGYYLTHRNAAGSVINVYNLNTGPQATPINLAITTFPIAVTAGDTLVFNTTNSDNLTVYGLDDNSRLGLQFALLPNGKYETGCVLTGVLT